MLVAVRPFPDHHAYTAGEMDELLREARDRHAVPVTTPKDAVRLPAAIRSQVTVMGVGLAWQEPQQIDQFLARVIAVQPKSCADRARSCPDAADAFHLGKAERSCL